MTTKVKESFKYWYRAFACVMVTVAILLIFEYFWYNKLNKLLYVRYLGKGNLLMIGVYMILMIVFINIYGGYNLHSNWKYAIITGNAK